LDGPIAGDEGIDVIINVRREKPDQKITVVVEEEEEEENLRALAMRVGAHIVVMKPITYEAIVQKVTTCSYQKSRHFWKGKLPNFSADTRRNNIRVELLTNH
jgi:PleD family two-component response regulator